MPVAGVAGACVRRNFVLGRHARKTGICIYFSVFRERLRIVSLRLTTAQQQPERPSSDRQSWREDSVARCCRERAREANSCSKAGERR